MEWIKHIDIYCLSYFLFHLFNYIYRYQASKAVEELLRFLAVQGGQGEAVTVKTVRDYVNDIVPSFKDELLSRFVDCFKARYHS